MLTNFRLLRIIWTILELVKDLNGNYGGLYSYGVRYIERVNPLFFFAENVSGLSSANDGKAFKKNHVVIT